MKRDSRLLARAFMMSALVVMSSMMLSVPEASVAADRPLLREGTETLYQRVLTRPGVRMYAAPDAETPDGLFAPFQPLYVFDRQGERILVGHSSTRPPEGWIDAAQSIEWKQNIVTSFTNPTNRNRQVLFDTRDDLEWLLEHESIVAMQRKLVDDSDNNRLDPEFGVLSVEPDEFIDIRERFYLMPILEYVEDFHPVDYTPLLKMRIASLPLEKDTASIPAPAEFDAGVVFVIDTTQSMEPYIRSTRRAIEEIMSAVGDSEVGEKIHFGAIGFRDNPEGRPGIEYRTREIAPLRRDSDASVIVQALAGTDVSPVSTHGFNEDSLAGIEDAVIKSDWEQDGEPFAGRYVILVTDAGPKSPVDPNARTSISANEVQMLAENEGIAILTLHLQTPEGSANHQYAADQYRTLSRFDQGTYYFPVEGGSEESFERKVREIVSALVDHVRIAMDEEPESQDLDPALVNLGHAMRLRYLGGWRGTAAPDVLSTWVTDRAAEKPSAEALTPRLLITKNELSTITSILQQIVELAESAEFSNSQNQLLRQVRDAVSRLALNPDLVVNTEFETLGGAVGEYLENLPYQSRIMNITDQRWIEMGTLRRQIIDDLRQKAALYRRYHDNPENWTALYPGAPDGEHVFALPLNSLP